MSQLCSAHPDRPTEQQCGECRKPICAECTVPLAGNLYCAACVARAKAAVQQSLQSMQSNIDYAGALGIGMVAAGCGAYMWQQVATQLHMQLGLVALLVGWMVGNAVMYGAGRKRSVALQWMSLLLAAVGIGYGLVLEEQAMLALRFDGDQIRQMLYAQTLHHLMNSPISLIIAGFGLYKAFNIPRCPKVKVE